ncbi:hypothetical protein AGLY_007879 [Aphis glycines]|uniref:Carboxylesterase type B domain-containing protein n=1 Tax=Aphis glycines TaxID=307491 RepID=A0A6G0TNG0_APHGL|nr:hypothetical protein AGLY_007879 [Aphis glycines]
MFSNPITEIAYNLKGYPITSATYLVEFVIVVETRKGQRIGTAHGEELPYMFGAPMVTDGMNHFSRNFTKQEALLSDAMILYLGNFARTGDPNDHDDKPDSGSKERNRFRSVTWDEYDPVHQKYLEISMKPRMKNHFRAHQLSVWLRLIPELHRAGMEDVMLRHNLFRNHDDAELYEGVVRPDPLSRRAPQRATVNRFTANGTVAEVVQSLTTTVRPQWPAAGAATTVPAAGARRPERGQRVHIGRRRAGHARCGRLRGLLDGAARDHRPGRVAAGAQRPTAGDHMLPEGQVQVASRRPAARRTRSGTRRLPCRTTGSRPLCGGQGGGGYDGRHHHGGGGGVQHHHHPPGQQQQQQQMHLAADAVAVDMEQRHHHHHGTGVGGGHHQHHHMHHHHVPSPQTSGTAAQATAQQQQMVRNDMTFPKAAKPSSRLLHDHQMIGGCPPNGSLVHGTLPKPPPPPRSSVGVQSQESQPLLVQQGVGIGQMPKTGTLKMPVAAMSEMRV